jgi:O-antigen/teichoic acid export membrane protein
MKNTILIFKNRIQNSSFLKNALTLISSTVVAQLLPIVTAPILTRIYSPDDYGVLGIYMAISGLFSVFSTLGYANAIMIAKEEDEARKLMTICMYNALFVALISLLVVLILRGVISKYFQLEKLSDIYLYFIPFTVLLNGLNSALSVWANRKGQYKRMAFSRIGTSVLTPSISIFFGLVYHSFFGLFLGLIAGQFIFTFVLWFQSLKDDIQLFQFFNLNLLKTFYIKHKNFFTFSLPADFINNFTNQIPVFMLSTLAGTAIVGQYNMSNRMLGLPSSFISGSIGEVFKQRATEDYHKTGSCLPIFIKTLKTLFFLSLPIFSLIFFFGPDLFAFAFGAKWRQAGEFSRIMALMFFFRFFVSPLTYTFFIKNKQKEDFIGHLLMLIVPIICYILSSAYPIFGHSVTFLLMFTFGYSLIYIYYLIRSYQYAHN